MKKKRNTYPRSYFPVKIAQMTSMFETFKLTMTNKTAKIESEKEVFFFSDKSFSHKVFPMFQKMKRDIKSSGITAPNVSPSDIDYYKFSDNLPYQIERAYGYDINKAYAACLFNEGYINLCTMHKLVNMNKKDRLAATGMIATSKQVMFFEKGEIVEVETQEDKELRTVFFHVSKIVGQCLNDVFNEMESEVLFYWVDGIVLRKPIVSDVFERYGFRIKSENISRWRIIEDEGRKILTFNKDGETKTFKLSYNGKINKNARNCL